LTDPPMRNLEYMLYILVFVYLYKTGEAIYVLSTYSDYEQYAIPKEFLPYGGLTLFLYATLVFLTFVIFNYRKKRIGSYSFEDMDKIDSWK